MRSLEGFPDAFLAEIAGQPDAMRRAAAALVDQRESLERIREAGAISRTIVFTGMGSSYDACYPAVNDLAHRADIALDTWAGPESGPSTMTFAAAMATLSGLARLLAGDSVDTAVDRTRTAAEGAARSAERLLDDPVSLAADLEAWHAGREVTVVLGRGPARAAAEMGALTLKESGVMAESLESAMFRHGPWELAGPGMAAIVLATEPETRRLDLSLAADVVGAGAAVMVVTPDGEAPKGARAVATGYLDRALMSAVSIVPIQLLAWSLARTRGRTPGEYTRASKVTTRE